MGQATLKMGLCFGGRAEVEEEVVNCKH